MKLEAARKELHAPESADLILNASNLSNPPISSADTEAPISFVATEDPVDDGQDEGYSSILGEQTFVAAEGDLWAEAVGDDTVVEEFFDVEAKGEVDE
jgi:hypothetical protein